MARGNVNHLLLALWLEKGRTEQDAPRHRSLHSPLCSLSLRFPAHASLAETNLASVTATPACMPLPSVAAFHLFILNYRLSRFFDHLDSPFPLAMCAPAGRTSMRHQQLVCVESFQRQEDVQKSDLTECVRYAVVPLPSACDNKKDVCDPAAEAVFIPVAEFPSHLCVRQLKFFCILLISSIH